MLTWRSIEATRRLSAASSPIGRGGRWLVGIQPMFRLSQKEKRVLRQVVAGSIRPPSRLVHTGCCESAKRPHCGHDDADAAHLFWDCEHFKETRKAHMATLQDISARARSSRLRLRDDSGAFSTGSVMARRQGVRHVLHWYVLHGYVLHWRRRVWDALAHACPWRGWRDKQQL